MVLWESPLKVKKVGETRLFFESKLIFDVGELFKCATLFCVFWVVKKMHTPDYRTYLRLWNQETKAKFENMKDLPKLNQVHLETHLSYFTSVTPGKTTDSLFTSHQIQRGWARKSTKISTVTPEVWIYEVKYKIFWIHVHLNMRNCQWKI